MTVAAEKTASPAPRPERRFPTQATSRKRLLADRAGRWVFTAGGLAIIASILAILIFILIEVWPLAQPAQVHLTDRYRLGTGSIGGLVVDEHRTQVTTLSEDGRIRTYRLADGTVVAERSLEVTTDPATSPDSPLLTHVSSRRDLLTAASTDGRLFLLPVTYEVSFEGQKRLVTPLVAQPTSLVMDPGGEPLTVYSAAMDDSGSATAAARLADGTLAVVHRSIDENLLTGEIQESVARYNVSSPYPVSRLIIDTSQTNLFAGTAGGELLWWRLVGGQPQELRVVSAGPAAVSSLTLLLGDRTLVVGQTDGSLSVWFPVRRDDKGFRLTRVRDLPALSGAIRQLEPSPRDKGFLAADDRGMVGLYHSTSGRRLWRGEMPFEGPSVVHFAPKSDAAYLASGTGLATLDIRNPHPEVSWKTLFGRVWYEGYDRPAWVWQSSGGTDDFEPKLGLTPLLVGTLKGTFYSLLIAVPLGVLGAMYLSQFMHPAYKRYVKPAIEIMAALPSVVLGFLAGLWLAPRLEDVMPGILLMLPVLPTSVLLAGWLWHRVPATLRRKAPAGSEVSLFLVALTAAGWACLEASPHLERWLFAGRFQTWLLEATGLAYDQRNAVVVGLAMGFAVIPIIFAISEDAFSNVPGNLMAGSLALGANRWQTVTRVVLPTASPGIFSAVMVGLGRAVGETMIVLMATGNTPIMDWNPFNGFRTLSANIAVEIPEAPYGGTLYRTLFLAALLLFVMTFLVNTVAELVRQRLRERYSKL